MSIAEDELATVLIIDDEDVIRAILQRKLELSGYSVVTAASAEEAAKYLAVTEFDLVLTDINMPGRSGIEILGQIREQYPHTAVILVTAVSDADTAIAAMKSGAYDYLVKPFNLEEVALSIERALEKRQLLLENIDYQLNLERRVRERTSQLKAALRQVEATYEATLDALVCALDAREHETQAHSQRVRLYTLELARLLKYPMERMNELGRGALLHDIGKIGVSDTILLKPGPLTADEWVEMRRHPEIGYAILTGISFLQQPAEIVLTHQERYDGSGYPQKLVGEGIPFGSRIFAVVDCFDALTSDRPYRRAAPYEEARAELEDKAGTLFDPRVVEAFCSVSAERWGEIRRQSEALVPAIRSRMLADDDEQEIVPDD